MKTKLLITSLLLSIVYLLQSQVPHGFNYQAVARNASGGLITNAPLPVRMTIQSDSLGGTIFWQELHSSVITTDQGVINLVIGKGSRQSASTAATFSAIDWRVTPKFLKIEIDYSGWQTLGVSRLWSVPYALVASDLAGSLKKLSVAGQTSVNDEALFEVKNKTGQTIFAVYNEGVRVYVSDGAKGLKGGFAVGGFGTDKAESTKYLFVGKDSVRVYLDTNPLTKKLKGGFAVGGYDLTKGIVQDYLDVNSDSVRIYIDSNPATKKLKGGFAVGGYDMTKGTNTNYMNVNTDASGIISPSQNRILWYPIKNAFLTGRVLIDTSANVGVNSFASGYESRAKGDWSQALGYKALANGDYSTAIGKNAVANNINSFAFGDSARAINNESYALGRGAVASGYRSFAFGSAGVDSAGNPTNVARALGDYSFAIGQGSHALGQSAFAIGIADTAGDFSVAIGYKANAEEFGDLSIGYRACASGSYSTAIGPMLTASGAFSTALGMMTQASGYGATAIGYGARSTYYFSTSFGYFTKATEYYSTAIGFRARAMGYASTAVGSSCYASGKEAMAIGGGEAIGDNSTAMGRGLAVGEFSTSMGFLNWAKGWGSTAMGIHTKATPYGSLAIGQYNDTTCSTSGYLNWVSTDPLFIIGNGSANNARSNAFTVLKNGNTAIGLTSPTQKLDVNGNARFRSVASGTFAYNLNLTSDGTLTTATSDISMKENIFQITDALNRVNKLRGVIFIWKGDSSMMRQIGMIAQEVEPVVPEIVFTNPVDGLKGINYSQSTALLVEAIKELSKQNEEQQQQIESYKSQLQSLQEDVAKIEAILAKGGGN